MRNEEYKYKIGYDAKGLIMPIISLIVFGGVTLWLYKNNNGAYLFTMIFTIIVSALTLYSLYSVLFVKILIGENSFTHQKGPGKSQTYEYSEIAEAWDSSKRASNGVSNHYFNYKTKDGKVHKFLFYPYQYDEVDYLLMKINGEETADNEQSSFF